MARKRYIVSHSNFVLKRKHQTLSNGTIFERDYMTITSPNEVPNGQVPIFGESNFKMTVRNGINGQLKHRYGNWEKHNNNCEDYDDKTIWTLNCLSNDNISSDSKIVLKPNYTSLLDFAYYGSCVDLIHVTINDIILKFPGELYLSSKQLKYYKNKDSLSDTILGGNLYLVDNPFNIDLLTKSIANSNIKNKIRYFCESYSSYILYNNGNKISQINWDIEYLNENNCPQNGDHIATIKLSDNLKLYYYYLEGENILLHDGTWMDSHIRPDDGIINSFFNELDDFGKLLLNRESNPQYQAVLDTPQETETGVYVIKKKYIWPINSDWNLDISSNRYNNYISSLIEIGNFYDNYYTDNLWRMLTHESIKNLDFTYKKENSNEDEEDYTIGVTRLEGVFKAYGRQFDDLKRYIDNIKSLNTITYDKNSNLPDYFLTDSLELSGWDVINVMPTNDMSIKTDALYKNEIKNYNSSDANIEFLRRLKINSKYILSAKGTKNSIEMMLSLFGLKRYENGSGDYILSEYSIVASGNDEKIGFNYLNETDIDNGKNLDYENFNKMKKDFVTESLESDISTNMLQGLPVKLIELKNEQDKIVGKYVIPWFDKLQEIDGNPYFQMKGGWGKCFKKTISLEIAPQIKEITETKDFKIYDETSKYLNIVKNLDELKTISLQKLNDNDIYYVYDISGIDSLYRKENGEAWTDEDKSDVSHYFILKNKEYSDILGYTIDNNEYETPGWILVKTSSFTDPNNLSDDGIKILYIESIIDVNKGNNPHVGFGKYDDGNDYLDYFSTIFKYSLAFDNFNDKAYDCTTGELNSDIFRAGFNLTEFKDNMKCWYFTDTNNYKYNLDFGINNDNGQSRDNLIPHEIVYGACGDDNNCGYRLNSSLDQFSINVGKDFNGSIYSSDLIPINPENGKSYDEAAANSIINTKIFKIQFVGNITKECDYDSNGTCIDGSTFKDYAYNKIIPYVKQLIPSTTIFDFEIEGENAYYTCFNVATMSAVINK